MEIQKSNMLANHLPSKFQPRYVLKRIGDEDINIDLATRNEILSQLAKGGRYVQIGEYTIMLNAIKSIDPKYGAKNIPPRPKEVKEYTVDAETNTATHKTVNQQELDEWDKYLGGKYE